MWTPAANHIEPGPPDSAADLGPGSLAPVLRRLAEKLRLEREDVVEHAVDAPSLEPVVSDHARTLEVPAQRSAERPIDSRAASDLCLLQQLQAPIESELPCAMLGRVHTPRTSTLPSVETLACTGFSGGNEDSLFAGLPSRLKPTLWHGQSRTAVPDCHDSSQGR